MVAPPPHLRYNNIKFIPKRGGEPLAKAANKRRKTKTNHLYDTAALGGGLLCPAGGGQVLLGTQPAGRRHGVRTTACQPAGAGGQRDEHQLVLFHRAAGAEHPAGHGTAVPAVHQLAYCARGGQRGADSFVSRGVVLLGAGLLVLPYGALYRQYVLEGLYYIPHIAISFVVLGCAVRILRGGRWLAPAAGMVLFSFAAALGGPRQLFILNIPLTVAAALLCWLDAPPADTLRQKLANAWRTPGGALLVPTLAADAAALAGYLVNAKVLAEKYHFQDQGYVAFTGLNLDRLQWFVNALLASFGWQEGKVFSLAALFNLAAAALILFCFVFSVWLVRGKARYPLGHRLVGAFFLAGAVCFALLYGLTNSGHSDRYLLPLAILFVPLLEIMLADCTPLHRPDARGLTALLAAILLLRAGTDYRAAAVATNPNQGAAQFLVQNGYRDGYASFWDGNVMTELTDGTLNVWTLTPNSVPELRPWLQVTSHLQTPPQGKIFFVISKWEAYGERQPTTQALADAMPEDALIYEDETVKIYGFASDEAMRQACGFAAFP